jgi:hypothetical protein
VQIAPEKMFRRACQVPAPALTTQHIRARPRARTKQFLKNKNEIIEEDIFIF